MKYSITKPETYQSKDGQEKTAFPQVGTVTILENPKGKVQGYVKIPLLGEYPIFLFEEKDKPTSNGTQNLQQAERALDGVPDIDLDNIPF